MSPAPVPVRETLVTAMHQSSEHRSSPRATTRRGDSRETSVTTAMYTTAPIPSLRRRPRARSGRPRRAAPVAAARVPSAARNRAMKRRAKGVMSSVGRLNRGALGRPTELMTPFDLLFIALFLAALGTLAPATGAALRGRPDRARGRLRRRGLAPGVYMAVVTLVSLLSPRRVVAPWEAPWSCA